MVKCEKHKEFFKLLVEDLTHNNGCIFGTTNGKVFELANWTEALTTYKQGSAGKLVFKMN